MKKFGFALGLVVAVSLMFSVAHAASPDAILGKWWNQEKESQIEIYSKEA
jgi:hypothetical protein